MAYHGGRTDLQYPTRIPNPTSIHGHLHDFLSHPWSIRLITVVQLKAMVARSATITRFAAARLTMTIDATFACRT